MAPILWTVGGAALAVALLAFAWIMQHRRTRAGVVDDDSDDAIVGMFPG
jgi:hypothetical protein